MTMHPLRILLQMFYHPGPAFAALKRAPQSWLPLLALAAGLVAIQFWYVGSVDQAWLRQHDPAADPALSGSGLMWTVLLISLLSLPAGCALHAVYLTVAGRLSGFPQRFSDWFAFSAWTSVPNLLLLPLMGFQIMTSGGQVSQEELSLASLNALALHLPYTHPWAGLATHLDLALIWTVVLTATGLRAWTGCRTAACLALAIIPVALVVGGWAVAIVVFG